MYKKLKSILFTALGCLALCTAQGQSINKTTFGKGLRFMAADSSFSVKIGVRFQVLYSGGQDLTPRQEWEDQFLIRRSRLKFEGFAYSPKLEYKIELGLSNRDIGGTLNEEQNFASNVILDAVAKWNFAPGWELYVGQTKLPGNRERLVSSQKMQFVDRSLLNSRFNIDRDAGLQLHHEHALGNMIVREIASISSGEGRNITADNAGGYDYTAKVEILPLGAFEDGGEYIGSDIYREETPKLAIAAAYDFNDEASRARGQLGDYLSDTRDLRTFFADAMFKYKGFSAMAEYAHSTAGGGPVVSYTETGRVDEAFVTGEAFNIQAGYLFKSNWEVAGRFTSYDPAAATMRLPEDQYTLGLSRYIVGHSLKVQGDLTLQDIPTRDNSYQARVQMELAF